MRVVLVSHASGFHGAEHILYNLSLALKDLIREKKLENLAVVLPKYGELARRLGDIADVNVIPMSWWVAPRVQFYSDLGNLSSFLSANPYLFLFLSSLLIPFSVLALSRFIRRFGGDLIWSNSVVNPCGAFSSAILQKKHIWHIHEVYGDVNLLFPTKRIFDIAYALSSRLVCVSNFVAKNLFPNKKINGEKIFVIYNSPSPEREKILMEIFQRKVSGKIREEKEKERIIGVVGKISPKKNQILVVKVFYHLKQRIKDLKLVFFGDEDKRYGAELRKVIYKLGLSDSVVFAGFKSNIQDIYESIDILLVPFIFETSSLVCIEAMASGVPVITHDVGAIGETVGDAGIVIKNRDKKEELIYDFVLYAEKLLRDKGFYFEVVKRQFQRFEEHFSFESFSQKIKNIIFSL
jgi:glycosyltransferase involved in cell wall biosynthesis